MQLAHFSACSLATRGCLAVLSPLLRLSASIFSKVTRAMTALDLRSSSAMTIQKSSGGSDLNASLPGQIANNEGGSGPFHRFRSLCRRIINLGD